MNEKIGLVTYYGDNYGACLQAYALQCSVRKLGYVCEIIEYKNIFKPTSNKRFVKKLVSYLKSRDMIDRYKTRKYILEANKRRHLACESFRQNYLTMAKNSCVSNEDFYTSPPIFDAYICGSDQIWNPTFYGKCNPIYYLDFVPEGRKRIAYAPSVGINHIDNTYTEDLSKYLNKFQNISVREISTVKLLSNYTSKHIEWVLDPTLLLNASDYENLSCHIRLPKQPYIFCYLFGQEKEIDTIKKKVGVMTGMPIVSIPFVKREILSHDVKVMDAGPVEFINLIKNAALVITDSFHATAFSINFKIPFISLLRQKEEERNEMSSRIKSILSKMNLENRLVKTVNDIPKDLLEVDFSESEIKLNRYRHHSIKYLQEALQNI